MSEFKLYPSRKVNSKLPAESARRDSATKINMLELETKEILTSFVGTLIALLSAGIVWLLKSAHKKHKDEVFALKKFEIIFANDITILKDNFEFLDKWLASIKNNRPYCYHFESYYLNEEESYKVSNLKLVNRILSTNYKLRRTSLDFDNIWDV